MYSHLKGVAGLCRPTITLSKPLPLSYTKITLPPSSTDTHTEPRTDNLDALQLVLFTLQWTRKVLTGLYILITFFLFKVQPPNFFSKQCMHK